MKNHNMRFIIFDQYTLSASKMAMIGVNIDSTATNVPQITKVFQKMLHLKKKGLE